MSRKFKDISGQKFSRLTALYRLHNIKGCTKWLCVCDCGRLTEVTINHLQIGHTKSCGCLLNHDKSTHNLSYTRIYKIYINMKQRCYNKNHNYYRDYGARGIAVCDEWKDDFMSFYDWSMANGYKDNLTIDRINVDGNYEPNNCRWISNKQQQRNKRNTKYVTYKGVTKPLKEWCEILGIKYSTTWNRINILKWSIERAFEI